MDGGAWWAAVPGVVKSQTRLSDFTFTFHFHALEKEMATHSSVLAWRVPGTGEPGGPPSLGSHSWTWLTHLSSSSSSVCGYYAALCGLVLHAFSTGPSAAGAMGSFWNRCPPWEWYLSTIFKMWQGHRLSQSTLKEVGGSPGRKKGWDNGSNFVKLLSEELRGVWGSLVGRWTSLVAQL